MCALHYCRGINVSLPCRTCGCGRFPHTSSSWRAVQGLYDRPLFSLWLCLWWCRVTRWFGTGEVFCALSAVGPYLSVQIPLPFEGETTGLEEWWQLAGDWRPTATVQHRECFFTAVAVLLQRHYTRMSGRENEMMVLLQVWDAPKVYPKVTGPVVHRHHRFPTLRPYQLCTSTDVLTTSTTSSRELTKVRRYLCLNRPKHQSGANFVWPTSMKDIRTVRCNQHTPGKIL